MAGSVSCMAQGTVGKWAAHPNYPFTPSLLLTWLRSLSGSAQTQQGRRSEALLGAHSQAPSVCLMQFSASQLAAPALGWHKSLCGQVKNHIRELILTSLLFLWFVCLFSGIKSLVQFRMWHTQTSMHNVSGQQPAVKAADSSTAETKLYYLSNHYLRSVLARC